MAAAPKLTALEKKDLDKFTKYLALKSVQVIVQSRLGDKVHTSSKPHTTAADWVSFRSPSICLRFRLLSMLLLPSRPFSCFLSPRAAFARLCNFAIVQL